MLPFRNGRFGDCGRIVCSLSILLLSIFVLEPAFAGKAKGKKQDKGLSGTSTASPSAGEQSLTNVPLPIGHEAKGLVLPDFDSDGHLRGKFEAVSAKRLDEYHIGFNSLKITTYNSETQQPDLTIDLSEAVLNLTTRILSSKERSLIKRADFNIAGDSVEFDVNTRIGRMVGHVKMLITNQSQLLRNQNE